MIDLHTHILPGVDDGAADELAALSMLRRGVADGLQALVLTPHLFSHRSKLADVADLIEKQTAFHRRLLEWKLPISVLSGAEIFFTEHLLELLKEYRRWLTINGSSYCLLEFPEHFVYPGTSRILAELLGGGFIPIIAHPERNEEVQLAPELAYEWVMAGAMLQLDIGSLRGDFGPAAHYCAQDLLACRLVQVVASDAHDTGHRPLGLGGLQQLTSITDADWLQQLVQDNPAAILADRGLPHAPSPLDPRRRESLWKKLRSMIGFS